MKTAFVLVALLAAGLPGCLNETTAPAEGAQGTDAPQLDDAAADRATGVSSSNLYKAGHWPSTGGEEIDAWGDYLFVDRGSTVEILRLDLRSGEADGEPVLDFAEVASFTDAPGPKDVKVSDDGNWLFIGNDQQGSSEPLGGTVTEGGFYVVDVSDKGNPTLWSYLPIGPTRGPHMVFYHQRADGSEWVYGASGDVSIARFDNATGELSHTSSYRPDPATAVNRDPAVIDAYYQIYTHDMFVMEEAPDAAANPGETLMYTASWDAGVRIVDVTDGSSPVEIGGWNDFPEGHSGNVHTVVTDWIGDRRITVGAVEVGFAIVGGTPYATDTEHSVLYVWDTTDPAAIQLLGTWENPDGLTAGSAEGVTSDELRSTHNVQLEEGRVYMAHYELGVWVLDVSTPANQAEPVLLGYVDEEGMNTWDVLVHHGMIYSSGAVGVQAFHFPLDTLGPDGVSGRA